MGKMRKFGFDKKALLKRLDVPRTPLPKLAPLPALTVPAQSTGPTQDMGIGARPKFPGSTRGNKFRGDT